MDQPTSKACTKCREVKSLEDFSPGQGKYKRRSWCKACRAPMVRMAGLRLRADWHKSFRVEITVEQFAQRAAALGNRCWMCGTRSWTDWDHVKPLSKGGAHCLANLRPACSLCNSRKGRRWFGVDKLSIFLVG